MRTILYISLLFTALTGYGQRPTKYNIIADSVRIGTIDNTGAELIIENGTRDSTLGVLVNVINGRTSFQKVRIYNTLDSIALQIGSTVQFVHDKTGTDVHVISFGKNASMDSLILLLSDGTRFAAKDSFGIGGVSSNLYTSDGTINTDTTREVTVEGALNFVETVSKGYNILTLGDSLWFPMIGGGNIYIPWDGFKMTKFFIDVPDNEVFSSTHMTWGISGAGIASQSSISNYDPDFDGVIDGSEETLGMAHSFIDATNEFKSEWTYQNTATNEYIEMQLGADSGFVITPRDGNIMPYQGNITFGVKDTSNRLNIYTKSNGDTYIRTDSDADADTLVVIEDGKIKNRPTSTLNSSLVNNVTTISGANNIGQILYDSSGYVKFSTALRWDRASATFISPNNILTSSNLFFGSSSGAYVSNESNTFLGIRGFNSNYTIVKFGYAGPTGEFAGFNFLQRSNTDATLLFQGGDGALSTAQGQYRFFNTSAAAIRSVTGTLIFYAQSGLTGGGNVQSVTERMRIQNDGTVSINNSTPSTKAILDVASTTQGFLPPRMTTTQRDAITTPDAGLTIYNTTDSKLQVYDGATWQSAW